MNTSVAVELSFEAPVVALSAADRCDRCGAGAFVVVESVRSKGQLMLCAHHARAHGAALERQGFVVVVDERARLAPAAGYSAKGEVH